MPPNSASDPEKAAFFFQKGLTIGRDLSDISQVIEMIDCYRQALALDPQGHGFVRGHLAWAFYHSRQFDRAADEYLTLLEGSPQLEDAVLYGGLSLLKCRRFREAAPLLLRAGGSRLCSLDGWRLLFYGAFYRFPVFPALFRLYHFSVFWFSALLLSFVNLVFVRSRFGTGRYYRWCIRRCNDMTPPTSYSRASENEFAFNLLDPEPGERVLDIGTGDSPFIPFAADQGIRIIAADPDEYVSNIRVRCTGLDRKPLSDRLVLMQADGTRLPFADGSLSKIVSISTVEHIPDDGDFEVMNEIARVLAPGGRAVVTTEGGNESTSYWQVKPFHVGRLYDFGSLDRMPDTNHSSSVGFYRLYNRESLLARLADHPHLETVESGFLVDRIQGRRYYPEFPETFWQRLFCPFKGLHGWIGFKRVDNPVSPEVDLEGSIGFVLLEKKRSVED